MKILVIPKEMPEMGEKVALKNYCRGYHHDLTGIVKALMGR